jgi:hypothetical protein
MTSTDDVLVADPPHRSVCKHCCLVHDKLRAEIERLRIRLTQEMDECERLKQVLDVRPDGCNG